MDRAARPGTVIVSHQVCDHYMGYEQFAAQASSVGRGPTTGREIGVSYSPAKVPVSVRWRPPLAMAVLTHLVPGGSGVGMGC